MRIDGTGGKCGMAVRWALTVVGLAGVPWGAARGQARETATKRAGISIFGGVSRVAAGYSSDTNYGAMVGADFTRYYRRFAPSLEVRYTDSSGSTVGESTFQGGFKVQKEFGRYQPYGDVEVGYGSITFAHPVIYASGPYASDNSFVYAGGGGLDYRLSGTVALKVDLQAQSWKLGTEANRFTPVAVTVGVSINLPFQGLRGRR